MLGDHSRLFLRKGVTWKYNITPGNDFGDLLYTKLWELKRAGTHNDNLNFYFLLTVST
jgi:hypothetical protein